MRDSFLTFFTFLVGDRYFEKSISLSTTKTSKWNDEDKPIHAELIIRSNSNYCDSLEHPLEMFLNQNETNLSPEDLLKSWQRIDKDTQYFMALITSVEMQDKHNSIITRFTELVGCLEKFDKNKSGGKIFLLPRLKRLVEAFHKEGFRGSPDLKKIKNYRNYQPHGDSASLNVEIVKEMYWYSHFLCALGRYHILKEIGFSSDEISRAFRRKANIYGSFSIKNTTPEDAA